MAKVLRLTEFSNLNGWDEDDHKKVLGAFLVGADTERTYKTRKLGVDSRVLKSLSKQAKGIRTTEEAKKFFEESFDVFDVNDDNNSGGFLTGFYEPVLPASKTKTDRFFVPIYKKPPEIKKTKKGSAPEPFFDRKEINEGALEGRGLELAWLDNPIDAYFVHVQGSAKLLLQGGGTMRITFAAKSGHEYTSLGKVVSERLGVNPKKMTAQRLKEEMKSKKESGELDSLLALNRSYIFFGETKNQKDDEGPIAAAKVPLVAGRSLAVSKKWHTFGSLIWVSPISPSESSPSPRLTVAHDTGSAIIGPTRGDLFIGSGEQAGITAGQIQEKIRFCLLIPKKGGVKK